MWHGLGQTQKQTFKFHTVLNTRRQTTIITFTFTRSANSQPPNQQTNRQDQTKCNFKCFASEFLLLLQVSGALAFVTAAK